MWKFRHDIVPDKCCLIVRTTDETAEDVAEDVEEDDAPKTGATVIPTVLASAVILCAGTVLVYSK